MKYSCQPASKNVKVVMLKQMFNQNSAIDVVKTASLYFCSLEMLLVVYHM